MSEVENPNYFKDMSSFNVQSSERNVVQCLGMYDPTSLGDFCICEGTYLGDKWESKLVWQDHFLFGRRQVYMNVPVYGKNSLNGRTCVFLYYKHYPFENRFIPKRISKGHWHTNCVVSCNDISIIDFMRVDKSKNVFFLGKLREGMPIISDSYTYSLFVIEAEKNRFKR
ncbi:hypothetical protein KAU33_16125 [Candidatus Dependentiae bacterium]|nr:hypothetical protein [Candidatus Dependentiae bacterium]